jgi:hypothetical protein
MSSSSPVPPTISGDPAAGNQNYAIPAVVDLADFRSVSIWCDRFNVSFGTAPLSKA